MGKAIFQKIETRAKYITYSSPRKPSNKPNKSAHVTRYLFSAFNNKSDFIMKCIVDI